MTASLLGMIASTHVWAADITPVRTIFAGGVVETVEISADGRMIVASTSPRSGIGQRSLTVWEFHGGKKVQSILLEPGGYVDVHFGTNNDHLVVAELFFGLRVYSIASGKLISAITELGSLSTSIPIGGDQYVLQHRQNRFEIWDFAKPESPKRSQVLAKCGFHHAGGLSRDGTLWISGVSDAEHKEIPPRVPTTLTIQDLRKDVVLRTMTAQKYNVLSIAISADTKTFAVAYFGPEDSNIEVRRVNDGKVLYTGGFNSLLTGLEFSSDGNYLCARTGDRVTVWMWSRDSLEFVATIDDNIRDKRFSPDSKWLVTGSEDGKVKIWNCKDIRRGRSN